MRKNIHKGQNITEFVLIALLLGVAAYSFLSPHAGKIASVINSSVPVKSSESQVIADLNNLFDTDSAEFAQKLDLLKQSSNPDAQYFADNVTNLVNDLGKIEQGKGEEISEENFKAIIAYLKTATTPSSKTETSGSVANILSANLDNSNASPELKDAANKIIDILSKKQISFPAESTVVSQSNNTADLLFRQITSNSLPASVLKYEGSTLTDSDLALSNLKNTYLNYFYVSQSSTNPMANIFNNFLALDNASQQYKLPLDLQQKYDSLVLSTKKSLSIQ